MGGGNIEKRMNEGNKKLNKNEWNKRIKKTWILTWNITKETVE